MGIFEWSSGQDGTMGLSESLAHSDAHSVVGGGDSVSALRKAGLQQHISHVSTGGGASLEYLENSMLPD